MPSLQKFHADVAKHVDSINRILCTNLIRHEYIVTTSSKAIKAQPLIEKFLSKALKFNKENYDLDLENKLKKNKTLDWLRESERKEIGSKIVNELCKRYQKRNCDFTRIIKLERRLGEDRAPMSVLELVDSGFEFKFWYTAKTVARLQLQGLGLDRITKTHIDDLIKTRNDGQKCFEEAVETAKVFFFKYNSKTKSIEDIEIKKNLENLPHNLSFYNNSLSDINFVQQNYDVIPRPERSLVQLPISPFLLSKKTNKI